MTGKFLRLDLDDVMPGMTMSDPLLDSHGDVLLPGGTVLTESSIQSLRRRGIDSLTVVNDQISEADLAAEQERHRQRLDRLFRKSSKDVANGALLKHIAHYRLGEPE
jgi:hypothetical protein